MKKKYKITAALAFLVFSIANITNPNFVVLKNFNHIVEVENANAMNTIEQSKLDKSVLNKHSPSGSLLAKVKHADNGNTDINKRHNT